jgi:NAD+ synthase
MDWQNIKNQMTDFLKNETSSRGFEKVVIGISGGLDSAIVSILAKEVFGDKMIGILMPSQFSSQSSINDAKELCDKFNIKYEVASIESYVKSFIDNNSLKHDSSNSDKDKLRIGNFSARARMSTLYDISSRDNALVIGTSNLSEIYLGYGTIYGDIACAINPLGNMFKSDEYEYGKFLGVTQAILSKKPSADLWEGQSDEDELGHTYASLDEVLKAYHKGASEDELISKFDTTKVKFCLNKIKTNSYKGELPAIAQLQGY